MFPERVRPILSYHFRGLPKTKGFRIALVKAFYDEWVDSHYPFLPYDELVRRAAYVHMVHEVSLIIDDIFDKDTERREQRAVHCMYGSVSASSSGAWLLARGLHMFKNNPRLVEAIARCVEQLAEAEILQWQARLCKRPTEFSVWKRIAEGDTGAMFRLAASFAGADPYHFRRELDALTYLYHGLDDIQDMTEEGAPDDSFVGGRKADLRDNIPTLLTCFTPSKKEANLRKVTPLAWDWLRWQGAVPCSPYLRVFFDVLNEAGNGGKQ